ncbi:MAG: HAMP domain-containing methyl-accepting chemotaxis protein [Magnetovibrionaceae bacterium]
MSVKTEKAPGPSGFLADLKVKTRILAGFGLILGVLIVVSIFGYVGFVAVSEDVEEYAYHVEEAALISHIETEFLKLRTHAREYANTGHEADAEAVHQLSKVLDGLLAKAKAFVKDPKHLEELDRLIDAQAIYTKDFALAEELEREFWALIHDKLDPLGAKIVADLDEIILEATQEDNSEAVALASNARKHALLARLYVNILIGRKEVEYGTKAENEFAELEAAMAALGKVDLTPHEKELFDEALSLSRSYVDVFHKVWEDEEALRALIDGEMAEAARQITGVAEALQEEIIKIEEETREKTMDEIVLAEIEMIVASGVGVAGGIGIALLLGTMIANPVVSMTSAMRRLADDDLEADIPAQGRKDEIGEMASAVQIFKDNAIRNKELEAEAEEQKARSEEEKKALMNQMAADFEASVGGVVESVSSAATELQSSAQSLSSISEETSSQATAVAAAAEEASSNVQTVASAAEELSSSISEINRQVNQSSQIASTAVDKAQNTHETVQGLVSTAQKIGEVVNLITDIAEQTNLLALNATIEAARAGEAGKGFAVVAAEVKNLANQTARATDEIGSQIGQVQDQTEHAAEAIVDIGGVIREIDEIAAAIAAAVEEQGAATSEIARNVEQAAAGTQEVSSNIQGVTQAAGEAGSASGQVLAAADELGQNAVTLKDEVAKFLQQVRMG